jgi:hypothetical protein
MRVVLQNTDSSLYLSKVGWVSSFKEALDFQRLQEAVEYTRKHNLSDVQVIIALERKEGGVQFVPVQIHSLAHDDPGTVEPRPAL